MKLRLSAPTETVWIIAVAAGVLGLLVYFDVLSLGINAFFLVAAGFVILAVATAMKSI
ncbi:MAG TPA: hypothetical protein VI703_09800 [Anaerolineales bacterium]|jgi:high-affinity Fe2+/Pb2+ permease|nr:hypothetical protein [Anaerolineales bacterium]